MINKLSGSVAGQVRTDTMIKKANSNIYDISKPKNDLFSKDKAQDVPSWLERMKEEAEKKEDEITLARITSKLDNGDDLSEKEMEYLRRNNPELYNKANAVKQHKQFMKRRLKQCRDRDEVKSVGMSNAMSALSCCRASGSSESGGGVDQWAFAAANREYQDFLGSEEYGRLPDKADNKKRLDSKA